MQTLVYHLNFKVDWESWLLTIMTEAMERNKIGFSALLTGYCNDDGKFNNREEFREQLATWWSSSKKDT